MDTMYGNNYVIRDHSKFYEALCILDKESYLAMWPEGKEFVKKSNCKNVKIMMNDAYPGFILAVFIFGSSIANLDDFMKLMAKFHTAFQIMYGIPYLEFCNQLRSIVIEHRETVKRGEVNGCF